MDDTFQILEDIKSLNFRSWSFDLIYGLPGQSLSSWVSTLKTAMSFDPYHISAYALSIEANTPYGNIFKDSSHSDLPQEDLLVEMYELANTEFKKNGLDRYEISNWAKEGHRAQHNLTYWLAQEYYAFGLSAHGYVNSLRYHNTRDLNEYLDKGIATSQENHIEDDEKLEEKILLGLRLKEGVQLDTHVLKRINQSKMQELIDMGFLIQDLDHLKLSDKAFLVSNKVIGDLLK